MQPENNSADTALRLICFQQVYRKNFLKRICVDSSISRFLLTKARFWDKIAELIFFQRGTDMELDDKLLEQINGGNSWQLPDNKVAYEDGKGQVLVLDTATREITVFPNRDEYYKVYE